MTEKRYFERSWEGEYYIFDSETITEKEFDEKVEYEDYQAFEDSMSGSEVVDRMNMLHEDNMALKQIVDCETVIANLEEELDYYKTKSATLETGLIQDQRRCHRAKKASISRWGHYVLDENSINDFHQNTLKPIIDVCMKYKIPIQKLPDVLEEYIAYDNEEYLEKLKNQY